MTTASLRPYVPGKWWYRLGFGMVLLPLAAKVVPWPLLASLLRGSQMAIVLSGLVILTIHGFRLRRGTWTFQSWRRFAASVVVGIAAIVLVFTLASGADARAWWVLTIGKPGLFVLLLSLIIGGPLALMPALHRFACDPIDSQFDSKLARLWRRATGAA